jgi:hypothetical protein
MRYKTVKDQNRRATSITILLNASEGYIVQPTDVYRTSKDSETGFPIMKSFTTWELLHTCSTWEVMGIRKGSLPLISYIDPMTGIEDEAPMKMNGIEIDLMDPEVISRISALKTYPTSVMSQSLDTIKQGFETYINDEDRQIRKSNDDSKFEVLERIQQTFIILQNSLFLDKRKTYDRPKKLTGQMITSRDAALTWKEAIELNLGMFERAKCKTTKHYDHELSSEVVDSLWSQLDHHLG